MRMGGFLDQLVAQEAAYRTFPAAPTPTAS